MSDDKGEQKTLLKMDMSDLAEMIDEAPTAPHDPQEDTGEEPEVQPVVDEPLAEEDEPIADEPQPEEEAEPSETEGGDESESIPESAEDLALRLQEAEAKRDHFEVVAGRNSGEAGFLRQKLREAEQRIAELSRRRETDDGDDYQDPEPSGQRGGRLPSEQPQIATNVAQSAMWLGVKQFAVEHPEYASTDGSALVNADIAKVVQDMQPDLSAVSSSGDPGFIAEQTRLIFETAHRKLQADKLASQRAERSKLSVDQAEALKRKKRVAAASSGGTARAAPTPKATDPRKMALDDLAKEIERRNA